MKKNICVLFGGQSSEHEVSLVSATFVMSNVDPDIYQLFPVGITKDGRWLLYDGPIEKIKSNAWQTPEWCRPAFIAPDAGVHGLVVLDQAGGRVVETIRLDCVIPVLHGRFGEDGTIQGLLELARIPYVGCGVTASANGMDKAVSRTIFDAVGIPQAAWTWSLKRRFRRHPATEVDRIEQAFSYPVFVKPANAGSSVGVSKAKSRADLEKALELAFEHDDKAVIEEFVDCREIEIAVLGGDPPVASACGEIVPAHEFYDYEAKYQDENSRLILPAALSDEDYATIRRYALRAFSAIGGTGLSRVDFFIRKQDGKIFLNEINTMPGFTEISMYPKLMRHSGIDSKELVKRLIELAMDQD